jgi:hypothetical protein
MLSYAAPTQVYLRQKLLCTQRYWTAARQSSERRSSVILAIYVNGAMEESGKIMQLVSSIPIVNEARYNGNEDLQLYSHTPQT